MLDNVNEVLLTLTVVLVVAAVAIRLLQKVNRVEWLKRIFSWLLGWVDVLLSAIVIALVIRTFVIEPFRIPSSSMEDTLLIGDHLFVNRFIYGLRIPYMKARPLALRQPRRGDIVVFIPPHQRTRDFIKRVIAVPGDTIEIRNQVVYINGARIDEPYVVHKDALRLRGSFPGRDWMGKLKVPLGKYFMMGDNRDRSDDSRFWSYASIEDIKGKALFIYLSWDADPLVPAYNPFRKVRWGRMFRGIR